MKRLSISKGTKIGIASVVTLIIVLGSIFSYLNRQQQITKLQDHIAETQKHYSNVTPTISEIDQGKVNTLEISKEATSRYKQLVRQAFSGEKVNLQSSDYIRAFGKQGVNDLQDYAYEPKSNSKPVTTATTNYSTKAYVSDVNIDKNQMTITVVSSYLNRLKKKSIFNANIVIDMTEQKPLKTDYDNTDQGKD